MAEISAADSKPGQRAGTTKRTKLSTRIDLTPMVDLGFLLITFFLFTTTLAKPRVMTVQMPYKGPEAGAPTAWSELQTMTSSCPGITAFTITTEPSATWRPCP